MEKENSSEEEVTTTSQKFEMILMKIILNIGRRKQKMSKMRVLRFQEMVKELDTLPSKRIFQNKTMNT